MAPGKSPEPIRVSPRLRWREANMAGVAIRSRVASGPNADTCCGGAGAMASWRSLSLQLLFIMAAPSTPTRKGTLSHLEAKDLTLSDKSFVIVTSSSRERDSPCRDDLWV